MTVTSTKIGVSAYGISDGGYPVMVVIVDGMPIGQQAVTGSLATYDFVANLDLAAAHNIQVAFYNTNGQRSLQLQSISVGGLVVPATDPRETYTSRVGTVTGSGDLRYGGVADFKLPAGSLVTGTTTTPATTTPTTTGTTPTTTTPTTTTPTTTTPATSTATNVISVSAYGIADSNGAFPALTLIVDGTPVGMQTVTGNTASYTFNSTVTSSAAHTVQVAFYNTNGTRALELNSITVNGTTYLATDPSETYSSRVGTVHGSGDMRYGGIATFTIPAASTPVTSTPTTSTPVTSTPTTSTPATSTPVTSTPVTSTPAASTPTTTPATTTPTTTVPTTTAFYVSTTGSDSADGSLARPFATLDRAVAAMKQSTIHTTYVRGGAYTLNSTVNLSASESGFTIAGYNGEKPVFSSTTLAKMVALNNASNVTISGIGFKPAGNTAIALSGGANNSIIGNLVQGGGFAIVLDGSSNNTISGNEIDQSVRAGIELKDGANGNLVDSNLINGVATTTTQGAGIYAHGVSNTMVTHNLVENTAGTGISFVNFDNNITINVGNTVSYNKVLNTGTTTPYDTGSIYVLGRANVDTKMVISNNYIDKTGAGGDAHTIAIYLDDNTNGVTVTNNIARNVGTHAVEIHNGHSNTIKNNIFDLDTTTNSVAFIQTVPEGPSNNMYDDVITRNIVIAHKLMQTAYEAFDGGVASVSNNLYYSAAGGRIATSGSATDSSPVFGDPRFADASNGNYALGSGSAAALIGFQPIDQSTIGLMPKTATYFS